MIRIAAMLALLPALSTVLGPQSSGPDTVVEPQSRIPFPLTLVPPGGSTPHRLVGTGLRDRTVFRVKVYAFGLYVDPVGARATLSSYAGMPASTLEGDARFSRLLLEFGFPMTLRLVLVRTLDGKDIARAFDDALRPRMPGAAGSPDVKMLDSFRAYFNLDKVTAGTAIVFSCNVEGQLTSSLGGEERPLIESKSLCRALFDIYLGEAPISASGKRSVIAGFPALLARHGNPPR